jgi:NADPH:quinone reductase-like Zn-dependent oxidoreductase/FMN phosphatase YigB (HAD superfamily)
VSPLHTHSSTNTIFLDVDNTLYHEPSIERQIVASIDRQIVANIHAFCNDRFNMTSQGADELHALYGSTIEGLRRTGLIPNDQLVTIMNDFYNDVYETIDVTALLKTNNNDAATGYTHKTSTILEHVRCHLASNSPRRHVAKVLQALGLCRVQWASILTPDSNSDFPTKANPTDFFGARHLLHSRNNNTCVLVDDSETITTLCSKYMATIHVNHETTTLPTALGRAMGWIHADYEFSQVKYLRAKNNVDVASFSTRVWDRMLHELHSNSFIHNNQLVIVDIGAGLLNMLRLVLFGDGTRGLRPLVTNNKSVAYYAYEPNRNLESECQKELHDMGFILNGTIPWEQSNGKVDTEHVYVSKVSGQQVVVHLRLWDYAVHEKQPAPNLIIGCCFADLINPQQLARSLLLRFLSSSASGKCLLYFPITFRGVTQFVPAQPLAACESLPSDTTAFALYSQALSNVCEHNLDPELLERAVQDFGGTCLLSAAADWVICPNENAYLWNTMLYFFATVAAPALHAARYDARGWLARARRHRPAIHVSNVDLLLEMPFLGSFSIAPETANRHQLATSNDVYKEIQFEAPGEVSFVERTRIPLKPKQVRIRSVRSLISSGTELKFFSGSFEDAALDVNIKGMDQERMKYPMAYGYCLVGRVIECGQGVDNAESLLGSLVFTFSPHATEAIAEQDAIQVIPDGIDAADAVFMPSIETAVSIVHDANPRFGEQVVVFGQGLVGLLVTAILSQMIQSPLIFTTVDSLPKRLAVSALMGSLQAIAPSHVAATGPFDIAIEVSGNGKALQSAIDSVCNGGKVVIASWYGSSTVELELGIDFHRSHKTLVTSQVSEIPAELHARWNKQRRFQLAWEMTRQLRPSRLCTRSVSPDAAQSAYEALRDGSEIAIAFEYE